MKTLPLLFLCFLISANKEILWKDGFESSEWKSKWHIRNEKQWGMENASVIKDKESKVLRILYPSKSYSPVGVEKDNAPLGGAQFISDIGSHDSLHLRYYLRFPDNFDFVKGGKLPGLCGGTANSGGNIPNGTDGFSTRFMWRTSGEGELYAYLPTSKEWGTSLGRGTWTFEPGKWYIIEQQVILNDPHKSNGRLKVWVNEELVLDETNLKFRSMDDLKIDGIFFSTFFGGGDASWATPSDTYIDFDNFAVSGDYIGN